MHFSPAVGEGDGLVDYEVTAGPSMRMAVDMAGLDEAIWIISSGSSGHPRSGRVDDQFEMWASGQSLPWVFTRERVEERSQSMMTIRSEPSTEDRPRTFRHR